MDIEYVAGYEDNIYALKINQRLGATDIPITTKRFDDGEIRTMVGFEPEIHKDLSSYEIKDSNMLMITMNTRPPKNPAEHTMNNLFILDTLARREPSRLFFLQPYMHYARQGKEFIDGHSWSLKVIAELYEQRGITDLITINSHLYGKESDTDLQSFFKSVTAHDLGAERLFADYLKLNCLVDEDPIIVGPDEGAIKMIRALAECFDEGEYVCIEQERDQHTGVKDITGVSTDISKVRGRTAIIYDDIIRSGETTCNANHALRPHEPKNVYAAAVHLVSPNAAIELVGVGLDGVLYTNSLIRHVDSTFFKYFGNYMHEIDTVPLVADYIKNL